MGLLIDTSILIHGERGKVPLTDVLKGHEEEEIGISSVTAAELLHGVHRATKAEIRLKRQAYVEAILEKIPVFSLDLKAARLYGEIWAQLAAAGEMIAVHDLLIGCTALSLGFTLLTTDRRDFSKIPGLKVKTA